MALRRLTVALFGVIALIAAAVIGMTGPASAAGGAQGFAAQAERAGLTEQQADGLQQRVDRHLEMYGGTQTAANKIELAGKGEIVAVVPGEQYARNLADAPGAMADCPYEDFCMFTGTDFTGDQFNLWQCGTYDLQNWNGPGSWINNQTPGTQAQFLDQAGTVIDVTPGAYSDSPYYDWAPVWHVVPC
ncbi:peptidase inhibitor family I36 protein [Streptomyces sp. NPDC051907]|uniref:peptidase inhibitor family I36 protein n=1 Tax=Streptomyces sp. NPDC051907 TaxID=3155284 RepID=UPI0034165B7D